MRNIIFCSVFLLLTVQSKLTRTEQVENEFDDQANHKINRVQGKILIADAKEYGERFFTNTLPGPPDCGQRQTGRVVNGSEPNPHAYPWQVAIYQDCRFLCSGTIVSQEFILTAASCLADQYGLMMEPSSLSILVGAHNLKAYRNWKDTVPKMFGVGQVYINTGYSPTTGQYDAALLRTNLAIIDLTPFAQMVCLDSPDDPVDYRPGDDVIVTGWGNELGMSSSLQQAIFNIEPVRSCQSAYPDGFVTNANLCADGNGKVTCQRDMGGPLHCQRNGTFTQIGIISKRVGCTPEGIPETFTKIGSVYNWIVRILANNGHPV